MPKARLKQLAQEGATDGQVVTWDNASSKWAPADPANANTRELFFMREVTDTSGDYVGRSISVNGSGRVTFAVPDDFVSLLNAELIIIPGGTTASADIDLNSDYAAAGEDAQTHSESNTTITFSLTNNQMAALDVSSVITSIAAGDYVGMLVSNTSVTGGYLVLGIRFKYSRV